MSATIVMVCHRSSIVETRALVAQDVVYHARRTRHLIIGGVGYRDGQCALPTRFPSQRTAQNGRVAVLHVAAYQTILPKEVQTLYKVRLQGCLGVILRLNGVRLTAPCHLRQPDVGCAAFLIGLSPKVVPFGFPKHWYWVYIVIYYQLMHPVLVPRFKPIHEGISQLWVGTRYFRGESRRGR